VQRPRPCLDRPVEHLLDEAWGYDGNQAILRNELDKLEKYGWFDQIWMQQFMYISYSIADIAKYVGLDGREN
jgi:hypothetical protein